MKPKVEFVAVLLSLGLLDGSALAQKSAAQQNMTVVVVNAHVQPSQPVQALRVSLSYLDGAARITDARDVTNSHGQAFLQVSPDTALRGDIRLEITGSADLVIYQPADGQLSAVPATVTVQLLPKGSPALLGPSQIEAMLHRSLLQVGSLQQQNRVLKQEIAEESTQKRGLTDALAEWAKDNGFPAGDVDQHVQEWAKEIQGNADHATQEQKALAELALKHYGAAAQLFEKAADADAAGLDSDEDAFLKGQRDKLRQLLSDAKQGAAAFQFDLQFHAATTALERAKARAAAEHKKFPEDATIHDLWLQSIQTTANARVQEGMVSVANQSFPLLAQSLSDYQSLLSEYATSANPEGLAGTQNNLGRVLWAEASRTSGDKSMILYRQAAEAFQKSQQFFTKADHPRQWAMIEGNIGLLLSNEGVIATGPNAGPLLLQAVQADQGALEVFTKRDTPQDWAQAESNLGSALVSESQLVTGERIGPLLDQALDADRKALEVLTKTDHPREWAITQASLGTALLNQAQHASATQTLPLLDQATQAFQSALEVFSQAEVPQQWANVQSNLGLTFLNQGEHSTGDKAIALLDQAVQAFRKALEVDTQTDLPQQWAVQQNNIGAALLDEGSRAIGDKGRTSLEQAAQAFENSLQVHTQADMPQQWAKGQRNLGQVYILEGRLATGDKALAYFNQAAQAFENALKVYTRADLPQQWAATQNGLGMILFSEGRIAPETEAYPFFDQAAHAFEQALLVYTQANFPKPWATLQSNVGAVLVHESELVPAAQASPLLDEALQYLQRSLEVDTKAELPKEWARTESNLGLAHTAQGNYTAALADYQAALEVDRTSPILRMTLVGVELRADQFAPCAEQASSLTDAELTAPVILLRDSFRMTCQWAAGDKASALKTEMSLRMRAPLTESLLTAGWEPYGMLRYLSDSPTFATGRHGWLALFAALKTGDGVGMTAALHELEPLMQH